MNASQLQSLVRDLRIDIIEMLCEARSGHPGGSLSAIDVMTALWFSEMQGVESPKLIQSDRDRFILSKGHAVPALYAILAKKGWIEHAELATLRKTGSRLQGHPDRVRLPIVEASTGSLGQGLSVAQGMAMGLKVDAKPGARLPRVFCMMGDGEIQEGQIWESAMSAAKYKLNNLVAILDSNGGQIDGRVSDVMPLEPIMDKWKSFGWNCIEIDGHDFPQILAALEKSRSSDRPTFILAHTVKGKGVSFMEGKIEWHGVAPKREEADRAIQEIRSQSAGGQS
jgi:transketolase